jgi:hypothetical protein
MGMSAITLIQIRIHDAERDALDNYRRQQLNPPSRAQAARELIHRALTAGNSIAAGIEPQNRLETGSSR